MQCRLQPALPRLQPGPGSPDKGIERGGHRVQVGIATRGTAVGLAGQGKWAGQTGARGAVGEGRHADVAYSARRGGPGGMSTLMQQLGVS